MVLLDRRFITNEPTQVKVLLSINPIAPRKAKTPQSFGHSECNRVNLLSEDMDKYMYH